MNKDFDKYDNNDVSLLITKFELMLDQNNSFYFDVEELEDIIEYYIDKNNLKKAYKAVLFAGEQHPNSVVFILRKAQLFASSNKTQKALELFEKQKNILAIKFQN